MTTRKYDFTTGIETSTAPSATDPSAPDDPVTLSYVEDHFVPGYATQATITALKGLDVTERTEGDIVFVKDQNVGFRYSASASDTNDDYFYLAPTVGSGRWIRITDMSHATGNLTVPGSLIVTGDLTVNGTTTTIATSVMTVEDANIFVNQGGNQSTANTNVAGFTVDVTDGTDARLGYDSTLTSKFKAGNLGSESEVVVAAGAQTITGVKTFSVSPVIAPTATFTEQGSTPATPASGARGFYATSTGFKQIDSSGLVSDIGGGSGSGSGEINVITDSSTATGWVASGAGLTVATSVTGSELPLQGVIASGIKITPVSGTTDYVRYRFTMPEGLLNTKLKLSWFQEALSGYANGDIKVELHTNTLSDYSGTDATIALSTDTSAVSALPNLKGQFISSFDSNSSLYYELRFYRTAGTTAIVLQNVIIGPGAIVQGAIVGPWTSYTPVTQGFGTIASVDVRYRRVGSSIEVQGQFTTGTVAASEAQIGLPTGLTLTGPAGAIVVGKFDSDASLSDNNHNILSTAGDTFVNVARHNMQATATNMLLPALGNAFASSTTRAAFCFSAPISEWAGSGTINLASNSVEYASNNGTWDAATTEATTVYGPNGAIMGGALTASRAKVVRFPTPIQATDSLSLEIQRSTGEWVPAASLNPYSVQNSVEYGVTLTGVSGNNTDVTVTFSRYRWGGTTFGGAGTAWPSDEYWRVVKYSSGQAVPFGPASTTNTGLVKKNKYQRKNLSTSNGGTVSFNNVLSGQVYRLSILAEIITTTTASSQGFVTCNDANVAGSGQELVYFNATTASQAGVVVSSFSHLYTASTTTLTLTTGLLNGATLTNGFATLEEVHNAEVTTDFT